jgi:tetratricopeptide (TPR) repeat protein
MSPITQLAFDAAGALRQISETERGERARRAAAGAMVLRAVERVAAGDDADRFALRRAEAEVASLAASAEKAVLQRLLVVLGDEEGAADRRLAAPLVRYACELEKTRRLPEADAAVSLALSLDAACSATALDAGRIARKLGDRERALAHYRAARDLDGAGGGIARLAQVGEAVVSPAPERALGRAVRAALREGDAEAAAVGREERASLRRAAGDRRGAVRDLCLAAARFPDPVDRARVAHELAGLLLAMGDAAAAREALVAVLAWGDAPQRDHARSRLHTLSRDVGDQVGMRRWRSFKRPPLVSLSAYRPALSGATLAPRLARWREALARRDAAAS